MAINVASHSVTVEGSYVNIIDKSKIIKYKINPSGSLVIETLRTTLEAVNDGDNFDTEKPISVEFELLKYRGNFASIITSANSNNQFLINLSFPANKNLKSSFKVEQSSIIK